MLNLWESSTFHCDLPSQLWHQYCFTIVARIATSLPDIQPIYLLVVHSGLHACLQHVSCACRMDERLNSPSTLLTSGWISTLIKWNWSAKRSKSESKLSCIMTVLYWLKGPTERVQKCIDKERFRKYNVMLSVACLLITAPKYWHTWPVPFCLCVSPASQVCSDVGFHMTILKSEKIISTLGKRLWKHLSCYNSCMPFTFSFCWIYRFLITLNIRCLNNYKFPCYFSFDLCSLANITKCTFFFNHVFFF